MIIYTVYSLNDNMKQQDKYNLCYVSLMKILNKTALNQSLYIFYHIALINNVSMNFSNVLNNIFLTLYQYTSTRINKLDHTTSFDFISPLLFKSLNQFQVQFSMVFLKLKITVWVNFTTTEEARARSCTIKQEFK